MFDKKVSGSEITKRLVELQFDIMKIRLVEICNEPSEFTSKPGTIG